MGHVGENVILSFNDILLVIYLWTGSPVYMPGTVVNYLVSLVLSKTRLTILPCHLCDALQYFEDIAVMRVLTLYNTNELRKNNSRKGPVSSSNIIHEWMEIIAMLCTECLSYLRPGQLLLNASSTVILKTITFNISKVQILVHELCVFILFLIHVH